MNTNETSVMRDGVHGPGGAMPEYTDFGLPMVEIDGEPWFLRPLSVRSLTYYDEVTPKDALFESAVKVFAHLETFGIPVVEHTFYKEANAMPNGWGSRLEGLRTGREQISHATFFTVVKLVNGIRLDELLAKHDPRALDESIRLIDQLLNYRKENDTLGEIWGAGQFMFDEDSQKAVLVDIEPVMNFWSDACWDMEVQYAWRFGHENDTTTLLDWAQDLPLPDEHPLVARIKSEISSRMREDYEQFRDKNNIIGSAFRHAERSHKEKMTTRLLQPAYGSRNMDRISLLNP